jgi:hypothetical protein
MEICDVINIYASDAGIGLCGIDFFKVEIVGK